ncbi:hypothetical protein Y043_5734 [Burkholderia pseudomallei MSHR2138]|nr:hypothetical protein Y043_5734 [Burkholderia pseudomallei MSHR2138]
MPNQCNSVSCATSSNLAFNPLTQFLLGRISIDHTNHFGNLGTYTVPCGVITVML